MFSEVSSDCQEIWENRFRKVNKWVSSRLSGFRTMAKQATFTTPLFWKEEW